MAGNAYLTIVSGIKTLVRGNQTSAGAGDAGKLVALNSAGFVDPTMTTIAGTLAAGTNVSVTGTGTTASPYTISSTASGGVTTVTATASATISAGMLVNFYNNAGALDARPADNSAAGSEANGFATAGVTNGASGTFTLGGIITGLSGLTIGATYFLGTVGGITTTAPTAAGTNLQVVGKAISATQLEFTPDPAPVTLA